MSYNKVVNNLKDCNIEELQEINERVIAEIKIQRKRIAKRKKQTLSAGDRVIVEDSKETLKGEIKKVNRTRAVVNIDGKGAYNVPLTMISIDN